MHPEDKAEKKLRPKYVVKKIEGNDLTGLGVPMLSTDPNNVDSPFVLMPRKDPAAYAAMIYYAQCCEPKLAAEVAVWLGKIAAAEPKFGTQGIRNYQATRALAIDQI